MAMELSCPAPTPPVPPATPNPPEVEPDEPPVPPDMPAQPPPPRWAKADEVVRAKATARVAATARGRLIEGSPRGERILLTILLII
jgi:hypothetical protein